MRCVPELKAKPYKIDFIEIEMPFVHPFRTSFGEQLDKQAILVRIEDEDGNIGWGETSVDDAPGYSYETIVTAWHIQNDFLIPILKDNNDLSISRIMKKFAPVRGHEFAKAGIESALLSLKAEQDKVSLGEIYGATKTEIPTGVSIGIQRSVDYLVKRVGEFLDKGYQRIKIKIDRGWELEPIEAIRKEYGDIDLMVDANSAFTVDDVDIFRKMDKYNLTMIEQPLAYNDILEHKKLQEQISTPICLDEPIHSPRDAILAVEYGCGQIINVKPARVGGYLNAIEIAKTLGEGKVWCGGMLETGIGRLHNVFYQARSEFTIPGDTSGSDRYYEKDIIFPAVEVNERGYIEVPKGKNLGFEVAEERIEEIAIRKISHKLF